MSKPIILSKSKYLAGLQCPKLLWVQVHAKDTIPSPSIEQQAIFDQGHRVTKLAQKLFPSGIEIEGISNYDELFESTKIALEKRVPVFEGAFRYRNTFSRPDILKPNSDGSWDIYEVKSSTEVKEINHHDVAFQKYCYEGAGLKIRRCFLVYVNNEYVRRGEVYPEALLITTDITAEVGELLPQIEKNIARMVQMLESSPESPDIKIGPQCDKPYPCALKETCWSFLPAENIFKVGGIRKEKAFELLTRNILDMRDIPPDFKLSDKQREQVECHRQGIPQKNIPAISEFLGGLEFPLYLMDFETIAGAIPYYEETSPFQQVPFQFSLHILSDWDAKPEHHSFLAEGTADPRPEFLKRLRDLMGKKGSILAFNLPFERRCLKESAAVLSEYQKWFDSLEPRFADLMTPFQHMDYYDPKQMGRYSIKAVYPALTGKGYEGLGIAGGGIASAEYARVTFCENISPEDRTRVRRDLEIYCGLDTQAMIEVLGVLKTASSEKKQKEKRNEI